jgi:hypothetical protein
MTNELWDARRKQLEQRMREDALSLSALMDNPAIRLTLKGTNPAVYIMIGTAEDIKALLPKE